MNELSLEQIGRLRDKLLELRIFKDQQDRRRMMEYLPFGSFIPQNSVPARETEAIIVKCSERDGFAALLDVLAEMNSESLDDFVEELDKIQPSPMVTWVELQKLKADLRRKTLPPDEIADTAWRETVNALRPHIYLNSPTNYTKSRRFVNYIDYLVRLISVEPLFRYLARCRPELTSEVKDIICEWQQKLAERLGISASTAPGNSISAGAVETTDQAILQIKVAQMVADEGVQYEIKAWLFHGAKLEEFISVAKELTDSCSRRTFRDANLIEQTRFLRATFRDVVLEVLDVLDAAADLLIEVFLPNSLLNSRVDLWRIPFGRAEKRAIALQFPIVVRSSDRLYSPPYRATRRGWLEKWRNLPTELQPSQITWAEKPGAYQATLFDELEKTSLTFVALTLVPEFDVYRDYPRDKGVLEKLVSAGVPIAVWVRNLRADWAEATRKEIEERLLKVAPKEWPKRVLEFRQHTFPPAKNARIICRGVTLLWDNADHIPPDCDWRRPIPAQRKSL